MHKTKGKSYWCNPFEIAWSLNPSESLIEEIVSWIKKISADYYIGILCNSSWLNVLSTHEWNSVRLVAYSDPPEAIGTSNGLDDRIARQYALLDCDIVLGLGPELAEKMPAYPATSSMVASTASCSELDEFFQIVKHKLLPQRSKPENDLRENKVAPLIGLILVGGKSSRMGTDKAALSYAGQPQIMRVHELLKGQCDTVYLSVREEQKNETLFRGQNLISDAYLNRGPLGGILSALEALENKAVLVVACDLPFLEVATLSELIEKRRPERFATAYLSSSDGLPEPTCAIYEAKSAQRMHQLMGLGLACPRKFLINSRVMLLSLSNPDSLRNINRPEEYQAALKDLGTN